MPFHELLITDISSSVIVVVMATFLTLAVTTCHVILFIVDAAQGTVVFVKVAIHQQRWIQTLFNGRTQWRDSIKWYEEVGQVKQIHKHLVAVTRDIQEFITTCYAHLMRQSDVLRL